MPKTALMTLGVCLAVALAVAAPIKAAAPSTAAQRIVDAHRKPVHRNGHRVTGRQVKKRHRTG